eukprot:COSAG01_NODE_410_length_17384_cov_20.323691_9_plen_68_part_00
MLATVDGSHTWQCVICSVYADSVLVNCFTSWLPFAVWIKSLCHDNQRVKGMKISHTEGQTASYRNEY